MDHLSRRPGVPIVLIVGNGRIGSRCAMDLAKAGVDLVLVDNGDVEAKNVVDQEYEHDDVGKSKALSLARHVLNRTSARALGIRADFLQLSDRDQLDLATSVDLVVAATDLPPCQLRINEVCLAAETPAVYPGIWDHPGVRAGEVGEVIWVLPGRHTPCYMCATWRRRGEEQVAPRVAARWADVTVLVHAAVQIVRTLLAPRTAEFEGLLDPDRRGDGNVYNEIYVHGLANPSRTVRGLFDPANPLGARFIAPGYLDGCPACEWHAPEQGPIAGQPGGRTGTQRGPSWPPASVSLFEGNPALAAGIFVLAGMIGVLAASAIAQGAAPSNSAEITYAWFVFVGGCSALLYCCRRRATMLAIFLATIAGLVVWTQSSINATNVAACNKVSGLNVAVPLPQSSWTSIGGASIGGADSGGTFDVSYAPTYWGGIVAPVPTTVGCDYRFDVNAKLLTGPQPPFHTPGYGVGVRTTVDADGVPHSQAVQYDPGVRGFRDTLYPQHSDDGTELRAPTDNAWHRISVSVVGDHFEDRVDGRLVFSGTTPLKYGGLFIRLWRASVELHDLSVTPL